MVERAGVPVDDPIGEVLDFWFGELDGAGMSDAVHRKLWFSADPALDTQIRTRYGSLVATALAGGLAGWADGDHGLVALLLLLDQFTRNIYRGSAQAFAGDPAALALARRAIAAGRHHRLPLIHRVFLYLPLEHSEDLADQDRCVALFRALGKDSGHPGVAEFTRYAEAHREVIARFGRFPHRNAALGRAATPAEEAWLARRGGF